MSTSIREFRVLGRLAVPIVVTQVTTMLMGVVDIIMVGRVGVEAIGAVSLGRLWSMGTLLFGMGVVFGIDPLITQAHGRRDPRTLGLTLQRGAVVAVIVSVPLGVSWLFTTPVLVALGQDPELARLAHRYVVVQIPSVLPFLFFTLLRQYLQGRGILRPAMWVAILANGVNALLDWALIYGHLGAPALGVTGAGIAAGTTRLFLFGALAAIVLAGRLHQGGWVSWSREALRPAGLREIAGFGVPVGVQLSLEIWAFEIATLFAGRLGQVPLAAHTIAINMASLTFMVPLGIAQAAVTRVGNLIGEHRQRQAQTAAWVALAMGAGVMVGSGLLFVTLRDWLPRVYSKDAPVIAATAAILPIAAAFQIFDGLQVVGGGILRAMGRTRPAAAFNLVGYYALALPIAWWLAFPRGAGLAGIWWGMALGLAAVALMLVGWVARRGPLHAVPLHSIPGT